MPCFTHAYAKHAHAMHANAAHSPATHTRCTRSCFTHAHCTRPCHACSHYLYVRHVSALKDNCCCKAKTGRTAACQVISSNIRATAKSGNWLKMNCHMPVTSDTITPIPLLLECAVTQCNVAELINGNMPAFNNRRPFYLLYLAS